jgi:hypothetical protein
MKFLLYLYLPEQLPSANALFFYSATGGETELSSVTADPVRGE